MTSKLFQDPYEPCLQPLIYQPITQAGILATEQHETQKQHMSNAQYVPPITAQKTLPQWYWHHQSPWQLHAERNGELYWSISSTSKTQQMVCPRNLAINDRNSQDQYTRCQ